MFNLEKKAMQRKMGPFFLIALVLISVSFLSCKKEEQPAKGKTAPGTNQYSGESVFDEVRKKVEKNPEDADAWYHLADVYERNGQYAEAIDSYKKILKIKPGAGYAYLKMGTAYDRINRPAEAVNALKKAVQYMPGYAVPYNNLGMAYGKLGNLDEEITALKKAIKLRPRYSAARYNLGITYLKKGDRKAAVSEYEALKDFDSGVAEMLSKEIKTKQ